MRHETKSLSAFGRTFQGLNKVLSVEQQALTFDHRSIENKTMHEQADLPCY